ncbi:hypothetical protein KFE96_02905 [Kordiimonas sp. SCSIO 12603]|uniref:hypothetical protein n=1 Tax=Kordiimonas sp. SCSIO 12603 TaxID=2829596 RepID=UPI002106CCE5|nr:hypothetical protein [Kordiimonas sp. SCSIO 12603]UTW59275.1 hypothetical protein KFE96_02905 [Kordiimonas sp. SCSIO 12603]
MLRFASIVLFLLLAAEFSPALSVVTMQDAPEEGKHKVELMPFTFTMQKRGRLIGKVTVQVVLEVQDASKIEYVKQRVPQIRADFNLVLSELSRVRFDINRPIDPDLVQQYLTPYADYRMGKDVVKVYLKQALIEPNK